MMTRFAERFERLAALISRIAQAIAGIACLACLGLVCWAVAMRYFLGKPQAWADEAVGWLVVAMVMLAVAEAQRRGEHIGVDWLVDRWTGARRRAVIGLGACSVVVVAIVLIIEGRQMVVETIGWGLKSNALPEAPLWAIQALIPIGAALLLVVALAQIAAWIAGREPAGTEQKPELDTHE
ncbi:MAG: TRAP transporter small permease [Alphaproteobacteria bacterium]|nr:TRAP transporter small permease [Alphaproteobacteria bacterium]